MVGACAAPILGSQIGVMHKRSVRIAGHATSVSLEEEFWSALKEIAKSKGQSLNALITELDDSRSGNLSSSLRVYVLACLEHHSVNEKDN